MWKDGVHTEEGLIQDGKERVDGKVCGATDKNKKKKKQQRSKGGKGGKPTSDCLSDSPLDPQLSFIVFL